MRGAVMTGPGEPLSIEELAPITLKPTDVLVRVGASGLCHSDVIVQSSDLSLMGGDVPLVLGHEGAGVVEEVGAAVTRVGTGDRVIASWVAPCGDCWWCLHDETHLCPSLQIVPPTPTFTRPDGSPVHSMNAIGSFADAMVCREGSLIKVDTDLPDEQLALIGCGVTTGVCAALNGAKVVPGSSVVVLGCGGVGQSVIQGARIAGAAQIIAVDPVPLKREMARQQGATHTIDPAATDVIEEVQANTGGRGSDYAFEAAGLAQTAKQGYDAVRRGGMLVLVGGQEPTAIPQWTMLDQMMSSKKVIGTLYGAAAVRRDMPMLVRLAEAGKLDVGAMVSNRITLDQVNDGLQAIESGQVIRSVIVN